MRLLVMGAGAMGSAVGGFMAKAGHEVVLVGRAPHMKAVSGSGLRISGIWGDHHVTSLDARTDLEGLAPGGFDLIVVSVKSYQTRRAVEQLAPLVKGNTLVCAYQNGLGNAECIAEKAGWGRTIGARAIFGVRVVEPGWVEVTVIANPAALGAYSPDVPVDRVRQIASEMDRAGLPTEYSERIETLIWGKVAYNSALNPLSALLDVPYGALLETDHTRGLMTDVVHELYEVAGALGVPMEPATPAAYMRHLFEELIPPTAAHYASMRADFVNRRRTEIDALNGAIVRYGGQHGIACPVNRALTRLVHAREHGLGVIE